MNTKNNNFICVILAGGLSKRFGGETKTFGKINGITIFDKIIKILKKQNTKNLINTNINKDKFSNNSIDIIIDIQHDANINLAINKVSKYKPNTVSILNKKPKLAAPIAYFK